MGNDEPTQFSLKPLSDKNKYITFGGMKEEEMIRKFNAFDIFWFAPDNSEKLENWIAFTNINVTRSSDINQFIQLSVKSRLYSLIIISTGSFAEEAVPLIPPDLLIQNIIIYCMDLDYHKKWSEKYKSIVQVFTHPAQIFDYLLKLQDSAYNIPLFTYKLNFKKEFNINYYDFIHKKEWKSNQDNFSLKLNNYEKFCVKALHDYRLAYSDYGEIFQNFMDDSRVIFNMFYKNFLTSYFPIFLGAGGIGALVGGQIGLEKVFIHNFMVLTLISLYFSKLPFLFGFLNYSEIESILNKKLELEELVQDYRGLPSHLIILEEKLEKEKVSILDEIIHLKYIQIFLIKYCKYFTKQIFDFDEYSKFPVMIKSFQDMDFCFKYFFFRTYGLFQDPTYKMRVGGALDTIDRRIYIFYKYSSLKYNKKAALKFISEEELKIMNKTLIIKDFIIIGNEQFHNSIKTIERDIIHRKIVYLSMITQIRDYLKEYNSKNVKYRNFSYIIIIKAKYIEKNYQELFSIMHEFGLNIILIAYIKDLETLLINKTILMDFRNIPIFFTHDINEMKNFIISQEYYNCGENFNDFSSKMRKNTDVILKNYGIRKINIFPEKNEIFDKASSEDGWELVDLIPKEMFDIRYLGLGLDSLAFNLFEFYKENQNKTLFFERYCPYFNCNLLPEINLKNPNIILKQFCYAYSLDEGKKSFYYMINKILRSGDMSKIEKIQNIISAFNLASEQKWIKSYEGEVFRATRLDNDFIEKKIIIGKSLTNLSFWSASKLREKAEKFLKGQKKNILFLIKTKECNVDIDSEELYNFNEKEVLFLPYSKFLVKNKVKKIYKNKEIYEVTLEGLDKMNERGNIKSLHLSNEEIYGMLAMFSKDYLIQ